MPPRSGRASAKKPVAKGRGRPPVAAGKRAKKPVSSQYKKYISRIQKQVHPKHTLSKKAMGILNSFAMDTFRAICHEASQLVDRKGTKTVGGREIECAVKILLPGELALHAGNEGAKAVAKYSMH